MSRKKIITFFAVFFVFFLAGFWGVRFLGNTSSKKPSDSVRVMESVSADNHTPEETSATVEPATVAKPTLKSPTVAEPESESQYFYDSKLLMRSFDSWMMFSENFHASYKDSSFFGNYQLVYPLVYPHDSLKDSKFDRLMLSMLFGKNAPKKVNRKSIQAALEKIMNGDVKNTHDWWAQAKAKYGKNWRDEVELCSGYFYAMPTYKTSRWMSFQKIIDSRCGGNGGPDEKYYTIVRVDEPYVMDTTAFVPDFREKLVEMITDNVIYNFYLRGANNLKIDRSEVREATAKQFQGNFTPTLTLSGVKFVFDTWALPRTCHADGRIPVIVPYRMIQDIFTQKFKDDIGL